MFIESVRENWKMWNILLKIEKKVERYIIENRKEREDKYIIENRKESWEI